MLFNTAKYTHINDLFSFAFKLAVHTIAHLFNFERFMNAQVEANSSSLIHVLSLIGNKGNESFLNPIRTNETVSSILHLYILHHKSHFICINGECFGERAYIKVGHMIKYM